MGETRIPHCRAVRDARSLGTGGRRTWTQDEQEFFVTVTKKVPKPLTADDASDRICEFAAIGGGAEKRRTCSSLERLGPVQKDGQRAGE
jgi:hypothetical protein